MTTPSHHLLPLLLTITAAVSSLSGQSAALTHPLDAQLLQQLKSTVDPSTIPPGSCLHSWNFSLDPCDSLFTSAFTCGFRCHLDPLSNSSRLTDLTLDSPGYSGPLAAVYFPSAAHLQNLDLSNNAFYGPLPASFPALTRLALSHNSLSGPIPPQLTSLTTLEEIYLDGNSLTREIPATFNALRNLKRLEIQGNQISGEFPELPQLGSLSFLDASDNQISGEIPATFPPVLVELVMRNNQIEGNIPGSTIANLTFLQVIDMSHNKLVGTIPTSLFTHPSLEQVTLSNNQFESVEAPSDLFATSQLISVDLSNNRIHGFLPEFLGSMPRLSALSLENNMFTGTIPSEYGLKVLEAGAAGTGGGLERLLLGGNYLYGALPGGFVGLKAGSVTVRLGDNCLYRCPLRWFFCEGGVQKSLMECRGFGPVGH